MEQTPPLIQMTKLCHDEVDLCRAGNFTGFLSELLAIAAISKHIVNMPQQLFKAQISINCIIL